ncbi:twin-arginine translocation signal domain-containing protein [Thalassovita litoralis]
MSDLILTRRGFLAAAGVTTLGSGPINRLEIALVACFKSPNFQGVS